MTGKPVTHSPPPVTYVESMRIEVQGKPICAMSQPDFEAWLETRIATVDNPVALREKLAKANLDLLFNTDKWFAMCEVLSSGGHLSEQDGQ